MDVVIRGGTVLSASADPVRADVGLTRERIVAVGDLSGVDARVLDATGAYVAPGLIDAHVHGEALVLTGGSLEPALAQGVTSVVLGQDGTALAPGSAATVDYMRRYFGVINGDPGEVGALSVADFGSRALNVAYLVPNGNVRFEVMGAADRRASREELARMEALVDRAVADGAVGLSSGLEYIPSRYADVQELAVLAARAGLYVTHMRGYGEGAAAAVQEARAIASRAGVPLHISHFGGRAEQVLPYVGDATFDSYPYVAGSTILGMALLPAWVQEGGVDATLERLADPGVRARVRGALQRPPSQLVLAAVGAGYEWAEGLALDAAAASAGLEVVDFACELLIASAYQVGVVLTRGGAWGEDDLRAVARHPAHMGGSDGIYCGGRPHPRGWGTFTRYLTRYAGDLWSWREAIAHLATNPARRFGLRDRGEIRAGAYADVIVFAPSELEERATYERPRALARGMRHVLVNGVRAAGAGPAPTSGADPR